MAGWKELAELSEDLKIGGGTNNNNTTAISGFERLRCKIRHSFSDSFSLNPSVKICTKWY